MKKITIFFTTILIFALLGSCSSSKLTTETIVYKDNKAGHNLSIELIKGEAFNNPTYVIWMEDMDGNFLKTIFITKSYATGIYGHKMTSDSTWSNEEGESIQAAALPYWTHKKGLIDGKHLIPTPKHPYVDAYAGATPKSDFIFQTDDSSMEKPYRILLEVNQPWDFNKYWTNSKYIDNLQYKRSAQPSVIYSVTVNTDESEYFLNPIGHGDPIGENGKLYTNLSNLTTSKEIFKSIKLNYSK